MEIKISKESLDAFKNGERLIPAPIDEKNITSDWIEDIFDNCCFGGKGNNIYVGFIKDCVVLCEYHGNVINWKVESECFNGKDERENAFNELKKRPCLTQSFFFKDED